MISDVIIILLIQRSYLEIIGSDKHLMLKVLIVRKETKLEYLCTNFLIISIVCKLMLE